MKKIKKQDLMRGDTEKRFLKKMNPHEKKRAFSGQIKALMVLE